jgi:hypothetical protein
MANENKDRNNSSNTTKEVLTTSAKKKLVKAICQEYHSKLDAKAPRVKRDLNYSQIKDVMFLNDATKEIFKKLAFDEKIDPRDSLEKWRPEVIAEFKGHFKFDASEEDVEDIQIELGAGYEKWFKENFPESKKKVSPANIRVSDFLTYMGTIKKDSPLPNLVKDGVVDLTGWKLKDLKMEALNNCRTFLGEQKTA